MSPDDILFYVLDAIILVLLIINLIHSSKVEVESKVGYNMKWIIPAVFLGIAVIGYFRYDKGMFRTVQTILLILMAILYWNMKNGLSKDGIVMMGSLVPYSKAKDLDVDENDCCVKFKKKGAPAAVYYEYEQLDEVRAYLCKHAGLSFETKKKKK